MFSSPRQCIAVTSGMILPWAPGNQSTEPTNETGTERTKRDPKKRTGNEAQRELQNPNGNTKAPKALTGTPRAPAGTPRAPRGQNTVSSQTVSSQIYLEAGEGVGCPLQTSFERFVSSSFLFCLEKERRRPNHTLCQLGRRPSTMIRETRFSPKVGVSNLRLPGISGLDFFWGVRVEGPGVDAILVEILINTFCMELSLGATVIG